MEYPRRDQPISTQLFDACTALMSDRVREIVESNPDLNLNEIRRHGRSLMTHCSSSSSQDILRFLLERGADPNLADSDGDTPLETAVWSEREDAVEILIQHGADPHVGGKGIDHLIVLAQNRAPDCLELLLRMKAEQQAVQMQRCTPPVNRTRPTRF